MSAPTLSAVAASLQLRCAKRLANFQDTPGLQLQLPCAEFAALVAAAGPAAPEKARAIVVADGADHVVLRVSVAAALAAAALAAAGGAGTAAGGAETAAIENETTAAGPTAGAEPTADAATLGEGEHDGESSDAGGGSAAETGADDV